MAKQWMFKGILTFFLVFPVVGCSGEKAPPTGKKRKRPPVKDNAALIPVYTAEHVIIPKDQEVSKDVDIYFEQELSRWRGSDSYDINQPKIPTRVKLQRKHLRDTDSGIVIIQAVYVVIAILPLITNLMNVGTRFLFR